MRLIADRRSERERGERERARDGRQRDAGSRTGMRRDGKDGEKGDSLFSREKSSCPVCVVGKREWAKF